MTGTLVILSDPPHLNPGLHALLQNLTHTKESFSSQLLQVSP
jgi:hypothetical protein